MKFIEGFIIGRVQRGTKKGQDYIRSSKRYIWIVPSYLEDDIELGDEVLVKSTKYIKKEDKYVDIKARVLVINIYETEDPQKRKRVLKILKKNEK